MIVFLYIINVQLETEMTKSNCISIAQQNEIQYLAIHLIKTYVKDLYTGNYKTLIKN